jgi:hypothetical protein
MKYIVETTNRIGLIEAESPDAAKQIAEDQRSPMPESYASRGCVKTPTVRAIRKDNKFCRRTQSRMGPGSPVAAKVVCWAPTP